MSKLIKKNEEIEIMRQGGRILAEVLHLVATEVKPGVSTAYLNDLAEKLLKDRGAKPSFLHYGKETGNPYPATLCTSVDSAVVHGLPSSNIILQTGQLVGLDVGCWYQGLCTDMAITVAVGKISSQAEKLIKVTKQALSVGLAVIKDGATVGDFGQAVQVYVEKQGFSVVKQMVGHGVGYAVHEDPPIPNFGQAGQGLKFKTGMTVALEPMVNMGQSDIKVLSDGWTVVTTDGSLSAHFEVTVAVTDKGCEILTK
ncbi:type I methionyl aminopeptidase [Patescibacteria group bacterium]|nr:type I methionyl aminopeptidase [Patescibacteria group bacterium]